MSSFAGEERRSPSQERRGVGGGTGAAAAAAAGGRCCRVSRLRLPGRSSSSSSSVSSHGPQHRGDARRNRPPYRLLGLRPPVVRPVALGWQKGWRALCALGEICPLLVRQEHFGHPQVDHLCPGLAAGHLLGQGRRQEDVLGLDVPGADAHRVQVPQGVSNVVGHAPDFRLRVEALLRRVFFFIMIGTAATATAAAATLPRARTRAWLLPLQPCRAR